MLVRGNGKYSVGEFDGRKFTPETPQRPCDLGPNFYATQCWGDIAGQGAGACRSPGCAAASIPTCPSTSR